MTLERRALCFWLRRQVRSKLQPTTKDELLSEFKVGVEAIARGIMLEFPQANFTLEEATEGPAPASCIPSLPLFMGCAGRCRGDGRCAWCRC